MFPSHNDKSNPALVTIENDVKTETFDLFCKEKKDTYERSVGKLFLR